MNGQRESRWLAMTGPLFTVLFLIAILALEGSTPGEKASAQEVVNYFKDHQAQTTLAAFFGPIGAALLIVFAAYVRARARERGTFRVGPAVLMGGAVVWASGMLLGCVLDLALASSAHHDQPQIAQTVNVLSNDAWIPFIAGIAITLFGAGMTVLSSGILPPWLGWIALVVGVVALFGPGGFAGFFVGPLWLLVAGVLLYRSAEEPAVPQLV